MAKAPYKLPNVFVGCPYDKKKFKFPAFKASLEKLPCRWYYADTHLRTKHLLGILKTYIKSVDYCIFDISMWNANVALEIGLAEGLGVEYYILLNSKLSKGVPADIQGLQRIEYQTQIGLGEGSLASHIVKYLLKPQTHPKNIWEALGSTNREMKFQLALAILAHLRDNNRITQADVQRLARGTYLRNDAQQDVIQILQNQNLLTNFGPKYGAKLGKKLFPEPLRIS